MYLILSTKNICTIVEVRIVAKFLSSLYIFRKKNTKKKFHRYQYLMPSAGGVESAVVSGEMVSGIPVV